MIKYILWDNDGVLVDTEPWYSRATRDAMAKLGHPISDAQYLSFMKSGRPVWHLAREAGISEEQVTAYREGRDQDYQHYLRTQDIEIPGVKTILKQLAADHRMAIITTSKRRDFELIHGHRGIVDFMEFVLTVEDYPRAKPQPDPYLAGLARFGATADETVVVEDSERGLRAAVAAGLRCITVANEFTRDHDFSAATARIETLSELPDLLSSLD